MASSAVRSDAVSLLLFIHCCCSQRVAFMYWVLVFRCSFSILSSFAITMPGNRDQVAILPSCDCLCLSPLTCLPCVSLSCIVVVPPLPVCLLFVCLFVFCLFVVYLFLLSLFLGGGVFCFQVMPYLVHVGLAKSLVSMSYRVGLVNKLVCRVFHTMLDWSTDLLYIMTYHFGLVNR